MSFVSKVFSRVMGTPKEEPELSPDQEAFWKAYVFSLQEEVMPEPNPEQIFFPALQSTVGVLAGDNVPPEVTNYGIYKWGDGVMSSSQPLYLGGGSGSYILNLQQYVTYVDVGSDPSPGEYEAYLHAVKQSEAAKEDYLAEFKQALELYKASPGSYTTIDEWAEANYPSFNETKAAWQSAVGNESNLRLQVYGPEAAPKNTALENIVQALATTSEPGFNMPTTTDNVKLDDGQSLAAARGKKVDFPPYAKIFSPLYSIEGDYKGQIGTWAAEMSANKLEPKTIELEVEKFIKANWEEKGFTHVSGDGFVGFFIGAWANYDRKDEFDKIFNSMTANDYQATLEIYGQEIFPLQPGQWDIPDVVHVFPKLEKGAPKDMMDFIQPKAVVVAYTIGMKVQFKDQFATDFNSHFKSITKQSGGFVIFGIDIGLGGESTSETEKTTHKATYDESSGVLTVLPNNDGRAILLGMVGQRSNGPPPPAK
ncbi:hypothetical protein TWF788_009365 [Orbilia oligospora]|uniref:Uncharacterized protein n=1 Tax=Orbilia oligospora TaxID=2813651 RepID=A0A7C8PQD2_ORBOL|nr:hypothetical protein TWF788_009365 [Orbilia oligospora]KAF3202395.1 hypothetical protein TWF191_002959 [Orbilia oligospora]